MNVLIFGLGLHYGGLNSALYYAKRNHIVTVTDLLGEDSLYEQIQTLDEYGIICHLGGHIDKDFLDADIIVKNPAINPGNKFLSLNNNITTDIIELLNYVYTRKNIKVIAITGTKGKSSTTSTIAYVLRTLGQKVFIGGNIGISGYKIIEDLEKVDNRETFYIVLELSSWQIRDLLLYASQLDFHFSSIILTSLFPDHGDYYDSIETYYKEKMQIFTYDSEYKYMSIQSKIVLDELSIRYPQNIEFLKDSKLVVQSLRDLGFCESSTIHIINQSKQLEHRREFVREINSIVWINDSSATIPEAMNFTLSKIHSPYILIIGGSDKNCKIDVSYKYLRDATHIVLLEGSFTRNKIMPYLLKNRLLFIGPFNNMEIVVKESYERALQEAIPITVVLSPAAASFGVFKNSDERGSLFKQAVHQLS